MARMECHMISMVHVVVVALAIERPSRVRLLSVKGVVDVSLVPMRLVSVLLMGR